jgi:hypothetical protein
MVSYLKISTLIYTEPWLYLLVVMDMEFGALQGRPLLTLRVFVKKMFSATFEPKIVNYRKREIITQRKGLVSLLLTTCC